MTRAATRTSLMAALALAACGGDETGAGPDPTDGAIVDAPPPVDASLDAPIDASPDAHDMGTRPFGGLRVWKDGCSKELWGRWRNDDSFSVQAIELREVDGDLVARTTFFAPPSFLAGKDDVFLFFDGQDVPDTLYQLLFDLVVGTDAMATASIDTTFFEQPGRVMVAEARRDNGRVMLELTATFSGSLQRLRVYDAARCMVATQTFATQPALGAQRVTVPLGFNPAAGTMVLITFEGQDSGAAYGFYATARLTVP